LCSCSRYPSLSLVRKNPSFLGIISLGFYVELTSQKMWKSSILFPSPETAQSNSLNACMHARFCCRMKKKILDFSKKNARKLSLAFLAPLSSYFFYRFWMPNLAKRNERED
jgi:hypothetical protein